MSALLSLFSCSVLGGVFFSPFEFGAGSAGVLGYIGPGAGLSMIGSLLAVAGVILLALLGPLLCPILLVRSLLRRRRERKKTNPHTWPATAQAGACCGFRDGEASQ